MSSEETVWTGKVPDSTGKEHRVLVLIAKSDNGQVWIHTMCDGLYVCSAALPTKDSTRVKTQKADHWHVEVHGSCSTDTVNTVGEEHHRPRVYAGSKELFVRQVFVTSQDEAELPETPVTVLQKGA